MPKFDFLYLSGGRVGISRRGHGVVLTIDGYGRFGWLAHLLHLIHYYRMGYNKPQEFHQIPE